MESRRKVYFFILNGQSSSINVVVTAVRSAHIVGCGFFKHDPW